MNHHSQVLEPFHCHTCNSTHIVKHGKSAEGKQRYRCRHQDCSRHNFILEYTYRTYLPEVKQQISDMAIIGGFRRQVQHIRYFSDIL